MVQKINGNLPQKQQQGLHIRATCPITDEQAKKLTEDYILISNELVSWWHCSVCLGWHINLKDKHHRFSNRNQ